MGILRVQVSRFLIIILLLIISATVEGNKSEH